MEVVWFSGLEGWGGDVMPFVGVSGPDLFSTAPGDFRLAALSPPLVCLAETSYQPDHSCPLPVPTPPAADADARLPWLTATALARASDEGWDDAQIALFVRTSGAWGRASESAVVAHVLATRDRLLGLAAEAQAAPPAAVVAVAGTGVRRRRGGRRRGAHSPGEGPAESS